MNMKRKGINQGGFIQMVTLSAYLTMYQSMTRHILQQPQRGSK
jgi:hypothetical protein